ncbi:MULTISPECIES: UDP-N-acetylmuramoyl-L-alanyl-D-glutamate--2,6-diaminopimelate ligase [Aeromonas]|uniref:UDP-N-acetylmuramoyl-L-alanyl-D-glutamate--2,6-diaminopimelate ligase n=1 Tax=Aeromonas veronii TaxID=654 RepID=A0A4S5CLZ4_AERVE|nr:MULTISPECIES: UDP-N-acetylmuramoyl-L-alanyl-D-glutamate--2,6-diaminopimelate ligase [Aeromonas]THJ45781.1 UDP-N-acetylmuramoyl-L-alanyl-D-glutamate--2,6-diaminopimelate ligase [Aeromonas veronii]TNH69183.1 UDP-N-acetylmuramoyl-L-alanyl-D-glutamate--2,6-diaminopimelate ligase [Aeromonas veronii]
MRCRQRCPPNLPVRRLLLSRALDVLLRPFGIQAPALTLTDIQLDSRRVGPGSLFVAIRGHQVDGRRFIEQAVAQGATAVVFEEDGEFIPPSTPVPCIGMRDLPAHLSALAGTFYDQPAKKLALVGITGTNGKSTTALLVANWRTLLGGKAGVMGTIGNGLFGNLIEAENTTGSAVQVQANLAALQAQGADLVAMEVSSHGLVQHRVAALPFAAAVFTNLSRDHLDYHGTMEAYGAAKEQLLQLVDESNAVINRDDELGAKWLENYPAAVAFSVNGPIEHHFGRQLTAQQLDFHQQGFRAQINSSWGNGVLSAPLLGRFNVSNVLAAMGVMLVLGYDFHELLATAPKLQPVTGRMECFGGGDTPLAVVDYAHTPDALEKALQALRVHCKGQLWCLVGCGGDRDRGKRPMMAAMAEQYADRVILTDDNPRTEEPARIMADMVAGLRDPAAVQVEHDRVKAISLAIGQASKQDIILVAGKGHEDYQIIGTDKRHYSDRETVAAALHTLLESFK